MCGVCENKSVCLCLCVCVKGRKLGVVMGLSARQENCSQRYSRQL